MSKGIMKVDKRTVVTEKRRQHLDAARAAAIKKRRDLIQIRKTLCEKDFVKMVYDLSIITDPTSRGDIIEQITDHLESQFVSSA